MIARENKHYFGRFSGRLAGVPSWRGGHFFTHDHHMQQKIENHPMFLAGLIELIKEEKRKPEVAPEERSTSVDLETMPWVELLKLARGLGFEVKGKKRVELIAEMSEDKG